MAETSGGKKRLYVALGAVVVHLGFVTAGALEADFDRAGWVVDKYAALSGAESAYGFFAPGVGTQLRVTFEVTDAAGQPHTDVLTTGVSREADLRVGDLVALCWIGDEGLLRSLTASWAGRVFAKHPGAQSVEARLQAYELPTMAEYRDGKRPDWSPYYQAKFVPRATLGPARSTQDVGQRQ